MSYIGSHVWKIRQKIGRELLITVTVAVLPINQNNEIKMVYASHLGRWTIVGGHVEEGGSYTSAALDELREEAGITARKEDLVPFATISGPGRVYHYDDGDTQPFTLVFVIDQWQLEDEPTDTEEIVQTKWVPFDEAFASPEAKAVHPILSAYNEYKRTGTMQMIEVEQHE